MKLKDYIKNNPFPLLAICNNVLPIEFEYYHYDEYKNIPEAYLQREVISAMEFIDLHYDADYGCPEDCVLVQLGYCISVD